MLFLLENACFGLIQAFICVSIGSTENFGQMDSALGAIVVVCQTILCVVSTREITIQKLCARRKFLNFLRLGGRWEGEGKCIWASTGTGEAHFASICGPVFKRTETVLQMGNLSLLKSLRPNKCRRLLLRPGNVCILYLNYSPSYSPKYAKKKKKQQQQQQLTEAFL